MQNYCEVKLFTKNSLYLQRTGNFKSSQLMNRVFCDDLLQRQFETDGYVVVPQFLNAAEVQNLLTAYHKPDGNINGKFHRTLQFQSVAYKKDLSIAVKELVTPKALNLLQDYRYLLSSFMVKEPEADNAFELHQNWNFVEEDKYHSVVFWVPLVDTDAKNGAMYVVKGSNRLLPTYRGGPNIPSVFEAVIPYIKEHYLTIIPLKAGDAIIFDDALLHYTSSNQSSNTRYAIAQVMIPRVARPIHYYQSAENTGKKIEVFEIDDDFYLYYYNRYPLGDYPADCRQIGTIPCSSKPLTINQFESLYHKTALTPEKQRSVSVTDVKRFFVKVGQKIGNAIFNSAH